MPNINLNPGKSALIKYATSKNKEDQKNAFKSLLISKKMIDEEVKTKKTALKKAPENKRKQPKNDYNSSKNKQREIRNLVKEADNGWIQWIFNLLNTIFNPIIVNRKVKNIISLIIILLVIGVSIGYCISSKGNPIFIVILVYVILYLFFIHSMNVKMACGKNASLLEILKYGAIFNPYSYKLLYTSIFNKNIGEYVSIINDYSCFNRKVNKNEIIHFKRADTASIKNLNTNFNKFLTSYGLNSNYPNNIPTKKYIFLSIYLYTVIVLLITSANDYKSKDDSADKGKTEQVINSIIVCLIFFIWTCVLDLPMWIIIVIFITLILIYLASSAAMLFNELGRQKIDADLLCKPHVIPFVNKTWAGVSFDQNFKNCMSHKGNSMFLNMMKPYLNIVHEVQEQVDSQNSKLNNLGNIVDMFQQKIKRMSDEIYGKIKAIVDKITRLKNKIYEIIKNIFLVFKSMIWSVVNLLYAIKSINNILDGIPFICFDENTSIKTIDNKNILIKDIQIGDILEDTSEVLGVIKSKYTNQNIYLYKNIVVTGDHFVYENEKHKTVSECKEATLIKEYHKEYLYCLITSTQKIVINDIVFSDYFDIDNLKIQRYIQKNIVCKLNNFNQLSLFNYKNELPLWCFEKSTLVTMKDGTEKEIKDIAIGEDTYYGKVYGTQMIKVNKSNIYKIDDIITTGDQIIYSNDIWFRVKDVMESETIDIDDNIFYNLSIDTNKLLINNKTFTDFEQIPNYGYLEFRDKSLP